MRAREINGAQLGDESGVPGQHAGVMTTLPRIAVYGTGRTAAELVAALPHTPFRLTTAVVHSPEKAGKDIGELTGQGSVGVLATVDLEAALRGGEIDVLLYAGLAGDRHEQAMASCAAAGVDQVHACFVDPRSALAPEVRDRIEKAARESGSRIVGTGMIPGLWLDVLPSLLTSGLPAPVSVRGERVSNISTWGHDVLAHELGIGTTAAGTSARVDALLRESARLIADALGLGDREPISAGGLVAAEEDTTVGGIAVRRGEVEGFDQSIVVTDGETERLRLSWAGFADPAARKGSGETDVVLTLTGGDASELRVRVSAPVDPYPGTAARLLHAARGLRALPPGLHPPTALAAG